MGSPVPLHPSEPTNAQILATKALVEAMYVTLSASKRAWDPVPLDPIDTLEFGATVESLAIPEIATTVVCRLITRALGQFVVSDPPWLTEEKAAEIGLLGLIALVAGIKEGSHQDKVLNSLKGQFRLELKKSSPAPSSTPSPSNPASSEGGISSSQMGYESLQVEADSYRPMFPGVSAFSQDTRKRYLRFRFSKKPSGKVVDITTLHAALNFVYKQAEAVRLMFESTTVPKATEQVATWVAEIKRRFNDLPTADRPPLFIATQLAWNLRALVALAVRRDNHPLGLRPLLAEVEMEMILSISESLLFISKDLNRPEGSGQAMKLWQRLMVAHHTPEVFTAAREEEWLSGKEALPADDMPIPACPTTPYA